MSKFELSDSILKDTRHSVLISIVSFLVNENVNSKESYEKIKQDIIDKEVTFFTIVNINKDNNDDNTDFDTTLLPLNRNSDFYKLLENKEEYVSHLLETLEEDDTLTDPENYLSVAILNVDEEVSYTSTLEIDKSIFETAERMTESYLEELAIKAGK